MEYDDTEFEDEIRQLIGLDKETFIRELRNQKSYTDSCHPEHKRAVRYMSIACGITKEQREQARAEAQTNHTSPEVLQERARIQNLPEFNNRLSPDHKKAHGDWLKTFNKSEIME